MKRKSIVGTALAVLLLGLAMSVGLRISQAKSAHSAEDATAAPAILIQTVKASRAQMAEKISLTGTIRPKNEVDIFAKVPGRIESLKVQVGDKVKQGQTLATIEHREIAWQARAAQAQVSVAKANLEGARLDYERTQALFKGGAAPQAQLDNAKMRFSLAEAQTAQAEAAAGLAQQQVANANVDAPISGTVIRRPVNVGIQVGPQSPLFTLQDVAKLKLESSVDAASFAKLSKDKEAQVLVDAFPGQPFGGKVSLLSPSLDAQSRRAMVEIEVDNSAGKLMPNMFARAEVTLGTWPNILSIPKESVLEAPGGAIVYRVQNGKAQLLRPKLGNADQGRIAVLEGLVEGDELAATALGNLSDGALVKVSATPQTISQK